MKKTRIRIAEQFYAELTMKESIPTQKAETYWDLVIGGRNYPTDSSTVVALLLERQANPGSAEVVDS